jgi:hypothetical protein
MRGVADDPGWDYETLILRISDTPTSLILTSIIFEFDNKCAAFQFGRGAVDASMIVVILWIVHMIIFIDRVRNNCTMIRGIVSSNPLIIEAAFFEEGPSNVSWEISLS